MARRALRLRVSVRWPFRWPKKYVIGRAGNPYLTRWDLVGNRHGWGPHLFLHLFHRSDSDAALHTHPWRFISLILKGGYWEQTHTGTTWKKPLSLLYRPKTWAHRIILEKGTEGNVWTLVLTGWKAQPWGFLCKKGWVHWKTVVEREDSGLAGCPE